MERQPFRADEYRRERLRSERRRDGILSADRWILAEYNNTVKAYREALDTYRFDIASNILYEFTGTSSCDWYLELSKPPFIKGIPMQKRAARHTLITVLESLLRLSHTRLFRLSRKLSGSA